jgi:hypothetical protein
MQRVTKDEVFFENIPFYGSNIVPKGSSGLGGEIYFNVSDIDFFGGDVNSTAINAGKEVFSLNVYRFDKSNLLEYLPIFVESQDFSRFCSRVKSTVRRGRRK